MLNTLKQQIRKLIWTLGSEVGATNYPSLLDTYSTKNSGDTISETHINNVQML